MSTLSKITIPCALLIASTICLRPAYGGSASVGETTPAPAAAPVPPSGIVRPATGVSAAPSAATIRPAPQPKALTRLQTVLGAGSKVASVLVIPATEMTLETYDRIVEDLSVMSRIIEKSLHAESDGLFSSLVTAGLYTKNDSYGHTLVLPFEGAGPQILRPSGGRPKAIYVGGYGAVFSLRVSFPLVPPPDAPKPEKAAEQTDQVWAAAQRELADPQAAARAPRAGPSGEPYKPEAVEDLKNTLTAVLKHASNIRDLEPESWLTILVQGPDSTGQDRTQNAPYGTELVLPSPRAAGRTLLTLRARKADLDQYAKGQLDETQFRRRVQIATTY